MKRYPSQEFGASHHGPITPHEVASTVLHDARCDRRYLDDETGEILPVLVAEYLSEYPDKVADDAEPIINRRLCAQAI